MKIFKCPRYLFDLETKTKRTESFSTTDFYFFFYKRLVRAFIKR